MLGPSGSSTHASGRKEGVSPLDGPPEREAGGIERRAWMEIELDPVLSLALGQPETEMGPEMPLPLPS